MFLSGKLRIPQGSLHLSLSSLVRDLEKKGCEVTVLDKEIQVSTPGLDSMALPQGLGALTSPSLASLGRDRLLVRWDDTGAVTYRFRYWSWVQVATHATISLLLLLDLAFGGTDHSIAQRLLLAVFANAIPIGIFQLSQLRCMALIEGIAKQR